MHLLSQLSVREYVTRRCWRSRPHTRWKLLPPCLPWRTNAPGLLRAIHGTQPSRGVPLRWGAPVLLPLVATKRKTRRTAARANRSLGLRLLQQQRPGARTLAASVRASREATLGRAPSILVLAMLPLSAVRSSSSRNASARGASWRPGMTHPHHGDMAKRRSSTLTPTQRRKNWGTKPQGKTSRASTPSQTPSPGVMSTGRSCTLCTAAALSSSPGGTSSLFAERSSR